MSLPADVSIIGIASIELRPGQGVFLRLLLSDGSVAATHWELDRLREFVAVVQAPPETSGIFPRLN